MVSRAASGSSADPDGCEGDKTSPMLKSASGSQVVTSRRPGTKTLCTSPEDYVPVGIGEKARWVLAPSADVWGLGAMLSMVILRAVAPDLEFSSPGDAAGTGGLGESSWVESSWLDAVERKGNALVRSLRVGVAPAMDLGLGPLVDVAQRCLEASPHRRAAAAEVHGDLLSLLGNVAMLSALGRAFGGTESRYATLQWCKLTFPPIRIR